jgi:hypothetical protein
VITTIARSLGEYFSAVSRTRRRWGVPTHKELWFRAEDVLHRKTLLLPGLYRPKETGSRKSISKLLELENILYNEFRRCESQLSEIKIGDSDWEWDSYFLMQHYGVPTRILDWTDGALIALHFAIREKTTPPKNGSVVYVLDPYWLLPLLEKHPDRKDTEARWKEYRNKNSRLEWDEDEWERLYLPLDEDDARDPLLATPTIPMLWDSPHLTRRVAAQRSRFMIFGADPEWLSRIRNENDSRVQSITIPVSAIKRIKHELREAGVTESVVYPDLDGLGRELKQLWNERR